MSTQHPAREVAEQALNEVKEFGRHDLRPSHLIIAGLVVLGGLVNIFMSDGWTVWPLVAAAALLIVINEAAERNGQGVPPLQVYALFGGAVVAWIVAVALLSAFNIVIILAAVIGMGYYVAKTVISHKERERRYAQRRAAGQCVHCGHPVNPELAFCENCGDEPDPVGMQLRRVASIAHNRANNQRAREVIQGETLAASASKREQRMIANRPRKSTGRKK